MQVEERIARLEKSNRRLRVGVGSLVLVMVAAVLGGQQVRNMQVVRAQDFEVWDADERRVTYSIPRTLESVQHRVSLLGQWSSQWSAGDNGSDTKQDVLTRQRNDIASLLSHLHSKRIFSSSEERAAHNERIDRLESDLRDLDRQLADLANKPVAEDPFALERRIARIEAWIEAMP